MSEEEQGFVIRDRRGRTEEAPAAAPETPPPSEPKTPPREEPIHADASQPTPPVTFSSFVFSLGTSTLMLLGESLDQNQPAVPMNLPQAKEMIDILSMLEEKTKNNLSSDEASVLSDMLYTLRMKYVALTSSSS